MPCAALVCCSDLRSKEDIETIEQIKAALNKSGCNVRKTKSLTVPENLPLFGARERAEELNSLFADKEITDIIDVSGGDLSNTLLPYLDFNVINGTSVSFWGYSDLTAIINALYAKTGKTSVLYNIRNILSEHSREQTELVEELLGKKKSLQSCIEGKFINGSEMSGTVIGGNARCFLKLAGTEYFPDVNNKLLLLESLGGGEYRIASYLSQLKQLGVFNRINGIILGTFTELQRSYSSDEVGELVMSFTDRNLPIFKTEQIGHGSSSRAVVIGRKYRFS